MGMCLDPTPKMGEFTVEVRSESFILRGADSYNGPVEKGSIELYPNPPLYGVTLPSHLQGNVEFLIEDLPKIEAAIRQTKRYLKKRAARG